MPEPTTPSAKPAPLRSHPEWTPDDARILRLFLESDTGLRAMEWMAYWAPELLDGTHKNKTLVASGQVKGYNEVLSNLRSLVRENPVPEDPAQKSSEYPDLDDNSKWTDEQSERK